MNLTSVAAAFLVAGLAGCSSPQKAPESGSEQRAAPAPSASETPAASAPRKGGRLGVSLQKALGKLASFYDVSPAPAEQGRPVRMARNKRTHGVLKAYGSPKSLDEIQFTMTLDEHGLYRNDDLSVLGNVLKHAAPDWKDAEKWLRTTISTLADAPVEKTSSGITVNVSKISLANLVVVKIF